MAYPQALCLRSLSRALELSDGPRQLAEQLQLSAADLKLMLEGVSDVPEEIFLRAVDLLLDRAVAELTERGNASARFLSLSRQFCEPVAETAELPSGLKSEEEKAPADLSATERVGESPFKWLPVETFRRLTPEEREMYLLELTKQLGLHP